MLTGKKGKDNLFHWPFNNMDSKLYTLAILLCKISKLFTLAILLCKMSLYLYIHRPFMVTRNAWRLSRRPQNREPPFCQSN